MAGMKEIKRRIKSIKSTQQITKAMKMVSAAKLRQTQAHVFDARPYAEKLKGVLGRAAAKSDTGHPLLEKREVQKVGYIVVTGDRGSCGAFNANIIRLTEHEMAAQNGEKVILAVGRKGRDYFKRRGYNIVEEYTNIGDKPTYTQGKELAQRIMTLYQEGVFDEVHLVYTQFRTAITQTPMAAKLLPVEPPNGEDNTNADYIYEPSIGAVLETLLPRYIETLVFRAILESKTSEHGARMTAMSSATDNATEIIAKMTLLFNRARQAAITREISEIVAGANALK